MEGSTRGDLDSDVTRGDPDSGATRGALIMAWLRGQEQPGKLRYSGQGADGSPQGLLTIQRWRGKVIF